jgi:hypothetical protein
MKSWKLMIQKKLNKGFEIRDGVLNGISKYLIRAISTASKEGDRPTTAAALPEVRVRNRLRFMGAGSFKGRRRSALFDEPV